MIDLFNRSSGTPRKIGKTDATASLDPDTLASVIRDFPIGQRLTLYPEYREELLLDSIIVGYQINRHFVHTPQEVQLDQQDGKTQIYLGQGAIRRRINEVQQFALLLPRDNDSMSKLDINRKAELQRIGIFRPGNAVTLLSSHKGHGTPSIETEVRRVLTLRSGLYSNLDVAVLDVAADTLAHADFRRHYRLYTNIPVTLRTPTGEQKYQANLRDFSENCARIGYDADSPLGRIPQLGRRMILDLPLPECRQYYLLEGQVIKLKENNLVLKLENIMSSGSMVPLSIIDMLGIKSTLANHPTTQQENQDT